MASQAVTLQLPASLYNIFRNRAEKARRPVEAEILDAVSTAATSETALPDDLAATVQGLETLDDDALWGAARCAMPPSSRDKLDALNEKERRVGLGSEERETREQLLHELDRVMLVRGHAARLLQERGHDVSALDEQSHFGTAPPAC